jgi:hypothetical protein
MYFCLTFFQEKFLAVKLVLVTKSLVIRPRILPDITLEFGWATVRIKWWKGDLCTQQHFHFQWLLCCIRRNSVQTFIFWRTHCDMCRIRITVEKFLMPTSEAEVPNYMQFRQDLAPKSCHTTVRAGLQLSRNLVWKRRRNHMATSYPWPYTAWVFFRRYVKDTVYVQPLP